MRRVAGAIEQALILTDQPAPFNVVIISRLAGRIDPERVRRALDHLQCRHPLLAARITQNDGKPVFESGKTGPIPLEVHDRLSDDRWKDIAGMGFWALARAVNRQVHRAARRGDKFAANRLTPATMALFLRSGSFRMGTAAVSYSGPLNLDIPSEALPIQEIHAFTSNMVLGPEYTALARLWKGKLWWDIVYLDCDMDGWLANRIATAMLDLLETAGQPS